MKNNARLKERSYCGVPSVATGYNPLKMPTHMQNNTPATDAMLMEKIGKGDRAAYTALVDRHMNRALNFVYRHIQDSMIAEDILQEGFLKVWQNAHSWEPQAQFTTWFYKLLYHLCVDHWRKNRRPMDTIDDLEEVLADKQPDAEARLIQHQQYTALHSSLDTLPSNQRTALILFYSHELSQAGVAQAMNISVGAVESLLFRGRQKLKQVMQYAWKESPARLPASKKEQQQ